MPRENLADLVSRPERSDEFSIPQKRLFSAETFGMGAILSGLERFRGVAVEKWSLRSYDFPMNATQTMDVPVETFLKVIDLSSLTAMVASYSIA